MDRWLKKTSLGLAALLLAAWTSVPVHAGGDRYGPKAYHAAQKSKPGHRRQRLAPRHLYSHPRHHGRHTHDRHHFKHFHPQGRDSRQHYYGTSQRPERGRPRPDRAAPDHR